MESENTTIEFYERNANQFAEGTLTADMESARQKFTTCLPQKGTILDFGCGSGRDTKAFLDAEFQVEAVDGSAELCALASAYTGIPVRKMLFQELDAQERYDGIWACASILHLPTDELPNVMEKIYAALKQGGVLYACFKYGDYEGMRNGRYFTCFTEETLAAFWEGVKGLRIFDQWITEDVRPDRKDEKWINLLARRV